MPICAFLANLGAFLMDSMGKGLLCELGSVLFFFLYGFWIWDYVHGIMFVSCCSIEGGLMRLICWCDYVHVIMFMWYGDVGM